MPLTERRAVQSLARGARVALVAPASGLRGSSDLERATDNARSLGWEPVPGENALGHFAYFAGSDAERLRDLNGALRDDTIDAVWFLRGGYGSARLLPDLDLTALRRNPKPLIGFSDVTALHCAVQARCDVVSFHGPVARAELSDFSRASLVRATIERLEPCGHAAGARIIRGGRAEGVLAGGNLAVLTSLVGTPYAPDLDGAILVLEDIDERTYRLDRMLRQLLLAGSLSGCRGIVFGACSNCREQTESGSRTLDDILHEIAGLLGVPCIAGAPIGHIADQWTIPLGARAHLDADDPRLNAFLE